MEIDGRISFLLGITPTGETFQFINIYQVTASNPTGQTELCNITGNWINKQTNARIILHGDLNCAHSGCWWDYAQPLNRNLGIADNKFETFLNNIGGHSHRKQEHTWRGKDCQAALDDAVTWNYHLPPHVTKPNPKSHKKKLTTIKFGRNYPTWTSPNTRTRHALTHRTFPRGLTLSSSKDMRTSGELELKTRSSGTWRRTPPVNHWPTSSRRNKKY